MRGLALAVAVCMAAGPALAQSVVLAPDQLRKAAFEALAVGQNDRALAFAGALVQRDASDAPALILQSRALRNLARYREAQQAARSAWRAATTDADRFGAALAVAQAMSSAGQRTAAQLWLRRAAQIAPNDQARQIALTDFGYVRSRNPWVLQVDGKVAPSSNINNGSSNAVAVMLGLPFVLSGDAQALSGIETELGFSARYRLPQTAQSATEFRFSAVGQAYTLSDEAQALAPAARASDYAFAALEIGAQHRIQPKAGKTSFGFGATLGHNWYGGSDLSDYLRLDLSADRPLTGRIGLTFGMTAERQWRADVPSRSATVLGASVGLAERLGNGDTLRLSLGTRQTGSDSAEIDHLALTLNLGWTRAAPVAGMQLSGVLGAETRDYAASPYSFDGREDLRITAEVTALFSNVEFMGFSPGLTLRASRNASTIDLYDSSDFGVTLGVRSAF